MQAALRHCKFEAVLMVNLSGYVEDCALAVARPDSVKFVELPMHLGYVQFCICVFCTRFHCDDCAVWAKQGCRLASAGEHEWDRWAHRLKAALLVGQPRDHEVREDPLEP